MSETNQTLGAILTGIRHRFGYTQNEVANRTNMSRSSYGQIEKDLRNPSVDFLIRLCILYRENPVTFLLPLFPEEYRDSYKHYLHFLTDIGRLKYRPDNKRNRKRKSCYHSKS